MFSNLFSSQCEQIIQHLNHKIPGVNTVELCQVSLDISTYTAIIFAFMLYNNTFHKSIYLCMCLCVESFVHM